MKPILAAVLAIGSWSVPAKAQQPDSLARLETRLEKLHAHIEGIESIRAIKRLQYAYGHYVELGLWNDFADLFTDDAVTNYQSGVRGKEAIRRLFFDQVGQGKLGLSDGRIYPHILFQPVITLAPDGRTAKGRWRILAMLGGLGGSATWYSGVYENEYVLDDGVWKIKLLHSEPKVTAAYTAAGWKDSRAHVPFHYTAASVTKPVPDFADSGRSTSPSFELMAGRVQQLAQRAARLNDQAAVTNLQNTYGYAMDRKLWNQVADLFSNDGTLELGLRGVYAGRTSIRHALDQFGKPGEERNDHAYLQTLVTVAADGRTANARGVELIMSAGPGGENGVLSEGIFENAFIKQDGAWKIQSVHFYPRMIVDAGAGWARSAKVAPGPSKEFPPDRPPSVAYEIYPKFAVAPFHFNNPVTGKAPQYPEGVQLVASSRLAAAPASGQAIRNAADLAVRLTEAEHSLRAAEAYDAAENLIGAYGYYRDEAPGEVGSLFARGASTDMGIGYLAPGEALFVNQIVQPVIEVAADGNSTNIRARLLDLGGTSRGDGYWTAGAFEGRIISEGGASKFQMTRSPSGWSARYPGGWGRSP